MQKVKPQLLRGFDQEYLPAEQLKFNHLVDVIRRNFELFGFLPIETPSAERQEILTSKGATEKEIYALRRLEEADADDAATKGALRFDLTVPLARYVAMRERDLAFPFRRYQIQRVWRGETPQANKGRFREFYQCDIDIIGREKLSHLAEAEIPSVIYRIFEELKIGSFRIRINNRKLLKGVLRTHDVPDHKSAAVLRVLDKVEKEPASKIVDGLQNEGVSHRSSVELHALMRNPAEADNNQMLGFLGNLADRSPACAEGYAELRKVVEGIRHFGVPEHAFAIDLSVVRGLDYYTGTIYETRLSNYPELGSICSGGRYDDLASYFTNTRLPGVGISIGLTRLFSKLVETGTLRPPARTPAEVLVTTMREESFEKYVWVANILREAGINTELYLEDAKMEKQLHYADKKGFKIALIAGDREFTRDTIKVKDLSTRTEREVELGKLLDEVTRTLGWRTASGS